MFPHVLPTSSTCSSFEVPPKPRMRHARRVNISTIITRRMADVKPLREHHQHALSLPSFCSSYSSVRTYVCAPEAGHEGDKGATWSHTSFPNPTSSTCSPTEAADAPHWPTRTDGRTGEHVDNHRPLSHRGNTTNTRCHFPVPVPLTAYSTP